MSARTLMIQGTSSDAGKSMLVAALCRVFKRRGLRVAPFKPQNMALNSAVTPEGGEIGRAQAVQAQAAGLSPHTDMNPVLLKPNTDSGCQVIVHGHPVNSNLEAWDYHNYKPRAMAAVLASHNRLSKAYDYILVEGAGSPAEINLRDKDIANMGFAEAVDCPVLLIADIDRGGVFAQLTGTLALLASSERERIAGFVINRFRGDISLLQPGIDWLESYCDKPVFGVLPYIKGLHLESEDSLHLDQHREEGNTKLRVVVPILGRISNHTDLDPLRLHPQVEVIWVPPGHRHPHGDLVVLPGSKSVRADLEGLRSSGWESYIHRHLRYGGKLLGICGGFQMLGETLTDPLGIEGPPGTSKGLGLFSMDTRLLENKRLELVEGKLCIDNAPVSGYEIHMGVSQGTALSRPLVKLPGRDEGALSADGQIAGCYLHGLFESTRCCDALLRWAGLEHPRSPDYRLLREAGISLLADTVESHLEVDRVLELLSR